MNLILDIGNTRTKAALFEKNVLVDEQTMPQLTEAYVDTLCRHFPIERAIASVVGTMPSFETIFPSRLLPQLHLLSAQSRLPIQIDYRTPDTLGPDRLASVVGAMTLYPGTPLLVIDAGTCITIDYLDSDHVYQGGAILPGLNIKFKALNTFTEKLPLLNTECLTTHPLTGKTTTESMISGVYNATIYELNGFVQNYRQQIPSLTVIITGGDCHLFHQRLSTTTFAEPTLSLVGLNEILNLN